MADEELTIMSESREELPGGPMSLPTYRCSMDKQIDILKAVVVFVDRNGVPASYKEIAPLAGVDPTIVSGTLGFWKDIGILQSDGRKYQPSKEFTNVIRGLEWGDNDNAWRLFRHATSKTWFASHLAMAFQVKGGMTLEDLINSLGTASGTLNRDKNTNASIRNLVALIEMASIVTKDPNGKYDLNPDLGLRSKQTINIEGQKSLVQVRIGTELYAVETEKLKDFVKESGRTLDPVQQQLD